jgi:chromosome segregation ATPase
MLCVTMATSGDEIGLLIGVGGLAYGVSKGAEAEGAVRALEALRVETDKRIAGQQETIRAREKKLEEVQSQFRTMTSDYEHTKRQLEATATARVEDQTKHAAETRNLNAKIEDLTRNVEVERAAKELTRTQNATLEARVREGLEREGTKNKRIAELETRIRELESASR